MLMGIKNQTQREIITLVPLNHLQLLNIYNELYIST